MKKFAVALIAILVVMGLTVMAQAEVRYTDFTIVSRQVEVNNFGESIREESYYVTVMSDIGEGNEMEVTEEEFWYLYKNYPVLDYGTGSIIDKLFPQAIRQYNVVYENDLS